MIAACPVPLDLFDLDRAMTPSERRRLNGRRPSQKGYAAPPATGPKGQTCGSCEHLARRSRSRTYLKCALMQAHWTGGPGTDVLARAPACRNWEARHAG